MPERVGRIGAEGVIRHLGEQDGGSRSALRAVTVTLMARSFPQRVAFHFRPIIVAALCRLHR